MKNIQPHINTNQLPMALKTKQELAHIQSSLLSTAGIPVRHNIHSIGGHTGYVKDLAFTPDGKRFVTASTDHTARLWDLESGRSLMVYRGHTANLRAVAVSPDGQNLATGGVDGCLKIWDLETGVCRWTLEGHSELVHSVVFSRDGSDLYSGGADGLVKQWLIASGKLAQEFKGHTKAVWTVALLPDGKTMLSAAEDGSVRQWDLGSGECTRVYKGPSQACHSLCIHPTQPRFYVGGDDGVISEWDLVSGECRRRFTGHTMIVDSLALNNEGATLVSSSYLDQTVRIWDLESGACNFNHAGPSWNVNQADFCQDGKHIIFCASKRVSVLERENGNCVMNYDSLLRDDDINVNLRCFCVSPSGNLLAAGSWNGTIVIWDKASGRIIQRLIHPIYEDNAIMSLEFTRDETYLVSGDYEGFVSVWNLKTGEPEKWFRAHPGCMYGVLLCEEDQTLITCARGFEDNIRVWDFKTILNTLDAKLFRISRSSFEEIRRWQGYLAGLWGHQDTVFTIDLSEDGRFLASGSADRQAKVWELGKGLAEARRLQTKKIRCAYTFPEHQQWVQSVRFSHNGRYLATGCNDDQVRIFDLERPALIRTLSGCHDHVYAVDFTPDDQKLLAGSWDRTLKVWDLNSGELEETYQGNDSEVYRTVFVPHGTDILVCGERKVRRWAERCHLLKQEYSGSTVPVSSIAWHSKQRKLVVGGWDNTFKILDLGSFGMERACGAGNARIPAMQFSASGNQLVIAEVCGTVEIRDAKAERGKVTRYMHPNMVNMVWLSPSGRELYTACDDALARCWDTESHKQLEFHGHEKAVNCLWVNRDQTLLYTAGADGTVRCFNAKSSACLKVNPLNMGAVNSLVLSWDEKLLYAGGQDGQVKILDLGQELLLASWAMGEAVSVLALDHDTARLATGGASGSIKVWDAFNGELQYELSGHEPGRMISGLLFDQKGKMLISASRDATVRFWSMDCGEPLAVFHNMEKGFVWTTPPDAMAPFGWFWTDRPELINILDCNEDGSHPRVLAEQDSVRQEYLKMYNNREMVVNRLNHYEKYRQDLLMMNQTLIRKQAGFKPVALLGENPVK